ncbi:MAG: hypothetical protein LUE96_03675 [Lachnospiraceae bacterium]|nr:hypothetical protein [Lachnospiraceae bacterium]
MKYVIWGCGKQGKRLFDAFGKNCICAFIDSSEKLQGSYYEGIPIISYETYLREFRKAVIIISPARNTETIVERLTRDGIDFLGNASIPKEIITGYHDGSFADLERLAEGREGLYLYCFTAYNALLYEYFTMRGKKVSIVLDGAHDEKVPKAFESVTVPYEAGKYDALCVTDFELCDSLNGENILPFYLLENYPFISRPSEALEVPKGFLNTQSREKKIIVSLTTYDKRLDAVPYAIGTIMRQTMKPDRIIVYMAESNRDKLPQELKIQISQGVEVRYVEDLKPHTKYYYAMREYPEDIVVTVDDDIFYRLDLIERLYKSYLKFPGCVSAVLAEKITFDGAGRLRPYNEWGRYGAENYGEAGQPSMALSAMGAGGVLYPPHCMTGEVFNKENFMKLCPGADDLWLKVMQTLNGTAVVLAADERHPPIEVGAVQKYGLRNANIENNGNDAQMKAILEVYNECAEGVTVLEKIMRG